MGPDTRILERIQELASLERPSWGERLLAIPAWHPRNEDPPEPDPKDPPEDPSAAGNPDPPEEPEEIDVSDMDPGEIGKRLGKAEAENQRLKRKQAEREKEYRQTRAQAKAAEDQRKAEQGEWKKLAEERADRVTELESELRSVKSQVEEDKRRGLVEGVADKVGFHNPKRAYAILREEMDEDKLVETLENEQLTEAALRRIAKAEPYLVDSTKRTGAGMTGRSGGKPKDAREEHNELVAHLLGGGAQSIQ